MSQTTNAIINAWNTENKRPHYAPTNYKLEDESPGVIEQLKTEELIFDYEGKLRLTRSGNKLAYTMTI